MGGESLAEVWRGGKVLVALERAPLQKGAPFARRARPLQEGRAPMGEGEPLLLT